MANITSTNSIFRIVVPVIALTATLKGYASDDGFSFASVPATENRIGVDGLKSSGYTPQLYTQDIMLQADSPSIEIFNIIYAAMVAVRDIMFIDGVIELPSVNKSFVMALGTLENYRPVPDVKKVLEPISFSINWGSIFVLPT